MEFEEICNCISIIHLLFISFKIWTTLAFHSYFIKRMSVSLTMTNRKMLSIPFLPSKLLSKEILGKYPLYTIFFFSFQTNSKCLPSHAILKEKPTERHNIVSKKKRFIFKFQWRNSKVNFRVTL